MSHPTHHPIRRPALVAAALCLGAALLTGCGDDPSSADEAGSVTSTTEHNDADVAFATDMIPHHAQALEMADLTLGRDLSPELLALVEDIRAAQAPEIETMTDWLVAWGEPIPETSRDHANAHDDSHGESDDMDTDMDMPGMMSPEELDELEASAGAAFEDLWLEMMIEHHRGAIEMAEAEIEDGLYRPAVELAEGIADAQQAEITTMEQLLDD